MGDTVPFSINLMLAVSVFIQIGLAVSMEKFFQPCHKDITNHSRDYLSNYVELVCLVF